MLQEVLDALAIDPTGVYVDATFGRGGHSRAILERLGPQGLLLVMDRDPTAFEEADPVLLSDPRVKSYSGTFDQLLAWVLDLGLCGKVQGILLDLGVSSPQLDEASRGFSFMRSGPLDMRMDPRRGVPLSECLPSLSETELIRILREYGQERYAQRIARAILSAQKKDPIQTTGELADIVKAAHPAWVVGHHPATRTFQALRMWINEEETQLKTLLEQACQVLEAKGRLVVIAFHSLEDLWVKNWGAQVVEDPRYPKGLPVPQSQLKPLFRAVVRLHHPTESEIQNNPRSRSARLRAWEKCG